MATVRRLTKHDVKTWLDAFAKRPEFAGLAVGARNRAIATALNTALNGALDNANVANSRRRGVSESDIAYALSRKDVNNFTVQRVLKVITAYVAHAEPAELTNQRRTPEPASQPTPTADEKRATTPTIQAPVPEKDTSAIPSTPAPSTAQTPVVPAPSTVTSGSDQSWALTVKDFWKLVDTSGLSLREVHDQYFADMSPGAWKNLVSSRSGLTLRAYKPTQDRVARAIPKLRNLIDGPSAEQSPAPQRPAAPAPAPASGVTRPNRPAFAKLASANWDTTFAELWDLAAKAGLDGTALRQAFFPDMSRSAWDSLSRSKGGPAPTAYGKTRERVEQAVEALRTLPRPSMRIPSSAKRVEQAIEALRTQVENQVQQPATQGPAMRPSKRAPQTTTQGIAPETRTVTRTIPSQVSPISSAAQEELVIRVAGELREQFGIILQGENDMLMISRYTDPRLAKIVLTSELDALVEAQRAGLISELPRWVRGMISDDLADLHPTRILTEALQRAELTAEPIGTSGERVVLSRAFGE